MLGRGLLVAALGLALAAPVAGAETALNIVPHGELAPGVPFAKQPGFLPADTQARMYDRLTPLFRNVTDQQLIPAPTARASTSPPGCSRRTTRPT